MSGLEIIAVLAGLCLVFAAIKYGPMGFVLLVAQIVRQVTAARDAKLGAALLAPRQHPADRWARTVRAERALLAKSLSSALDRTQMRSLMPMMY